MLCSCIARVGSGFLFLGGGGVPEFEVVETFSRFEVWLVLYLMTELSSRWRPPNYMDSAGVAHLEGHSYLEVTGSSPALGYSVISQFSFFIEDIQFARFALCLSITIYYPAIHEGFYLFLFKIIKKFIVIISFWHYI